MEQNQTHTLKCPLCGGTEFKNEKSRLESAWGATEHKANMKICAQCNYIMLFSEGCTWWRID